MPHFVLSDGCTSEISTHLWVKRLKCAILAPHCVKLLTPSSRSRAAGAPPVLLDGDDPSPTTDAADFASLVNGISFSLSRRLRRRYCSNRGWADALNSRQPCRKPGSASLRIAPEFLRFGGGGDRSAGSTWDAPTLCRARGAYCLRPTTNRSNAILARCNSGDSRIEKRLAAQR